MQKRKIAHEALNGKFALLEMRYNYGIVPAQVTFFVLGKVLFKVYANGRFILKEEDYNFFTREIVSPTLKSAFGQKNILWKNGY